MNFYSNCNCYCTTVDNKAHGWFILHSKIIDSEQLSQALGNYGAQRKKKKAGLHKNIYKLSLHIKYAQAKHVQWIYVTHDASNKKIKQQQKQNLIS